MRWLYHWALTESWLVAVDLVGRHARSWSYIQGSTRNRENEGKTDNLGFMLCSVYAVLGVCCPRFMLYSVYAILSVNSLSWHGEIERDDLTLYSMMMVEKERLGMKMGTNMKDTSRYEKSGVRLAWLDLEDLISVFLPAGSGVVPAVSGMVNWLPYEILLSLSFSWWFPPISSHLSLSLPSPKNTKLSHPYLSLHAIIMS